MRRVVRYGSAAFAAVALIGAVIALVAPAEAQDKMAAVEQRQQLMKQNGASAGKIAGFLRGQGTAEDVAAAAGVVAENAKKLPALFVAGTSSADMPGKTRAKPEMLTEKAKADQYFATLADRAMALQAAAKEGDKQKIQAAFGAMSRESCGGCHNDFRGPPLN